MAKTAVAADPMADLERARAARAEVLARVKARIPVPETHRYEDPRTGRVMKIRDEPKLTADPPATLADWVDDRILGALGSRTRLNPAEQAFLEICEACRTEDPRTVGRAVRATARLDAHVAHRALYPALTEMAGRAPGFASAVVQAMLTEARKLGWDQRPRPGRRAAGLEVSPA